MQQIPSDVLFLTIDYLDSPTMINCREVSKKWLDVVDGNRSLYSFFYLPKDSKPFNQDMFNLFAEKSVSGLRAVIINQRLSSYKRLFESLSKSSSTQLRYFLLDDVHARNDLNPIIYLNMKMKNLYSFSYYSDYYTERPRFRLLDDLATHRLPPDSRVTSSLASLHLVDDAYWHYPDQHFKWFSHSLKYLAIKIAGDGPFATVDFPNLQVLELHCYDKRCTFPSKSCPNLKVIHLIVYVQDFFSIEGLPVSLEKMWLNWEHPGSGSRSTGLTELDSSFPHLEELRFGNKFNFSSLLSNAMRARRSAVEQGAEVGGIKMKPIKKLTVRKQLFSNGEWSELEDLVEELVDLKDAPEVEEISV